MTNTPNIKMHDIVSGLLDKAYEVRVSDLSQSIAWTQEARELSDTHELPLLKAKSLSKLALYNMIRGKHMESLELSHEATAIYKKLHDEKGVAEVNYSIAGIYYKTNNYHLGMVYLLDCLFTFRKYNDYHNVSRTLKSLGAIYDLLGDTENAENSYEEAVKAGQKIGSKNLESNAYNPLSGLMLKFDNPAKASEYIERAITLKEETKDLRGMAFSIYGRAKVHMYNKNYAEAEKDFQTALQVHEQFGEHFGTAMTKHKLARLWTVQGKNEEAKQLLKEIIVFCEVHNNILGNIKAKKFLYKIYKEEGDMNEALSYLEKYILLKEQVTSAQTFKVLENYEKAAQIKLSEREARFELDKADVHARKETVEQEAKVRQDFLSAMSHEIRTPLNAITSIISLLEERASSDEQKLLMSLQFSSKNLLRIIDDILDFSKLDSNKMSLEEYPIAIHRLLSNIHQTYATMANEKGIGLTMEISPEVAKIYLMDETRIFQILGNLLSNGIKFTKKGSVTLRVEMLKQTNTHDTLLCSVVDTGMGIAKKEIDRLFDSFYIPSNITTRNQGGTGLGLAIVKKMIQLHGSSIEIESTEGEGSTFSFQLTLEKSELPDIRPTQRIDKLIDKEVLLAEDNEINALVMTQLLQKWKIKVSRASNGLQALDMARSQEFDFILMDIHMPELNGFEAAKEIRLEKGSNYNTPIFALTADITAITHEDYEEYFDDFLRKPLNVERLTDLLTQFEGYKVVPIK